MSKNILVTGGAGMIGSNITKKLLERGNNVIVLDDLSAYPFDYLHEFGWSYRQSLALFPGSDYCCHYWLSWQPIWVYQTHGISGKATK